MTAAQAPIEGPFGSVAPTRPVMAATLRHASGLTIELLENGCVFAIRHGGILASQVLGSPLEGGLANLWIRRWTDAGADAAPVLGPASDSRFRASSRGAIWEGRVDGVAYTCSLRLGGHRATWFWTVRLVNETTDPVTLDVVLAQDLGIAAEAAVRTSELYTSQYIDHRALEDDDLGFVLCSRQNLAQDGSYPWVMHGCVERAAGYLTDGLQFHGLGSKATGRPVALTQAAFPNRVLQYELALPTLVSEPVPLAPGATAEVAFFAVFEPDHPAASSARDLARARTAVRAYRALPALVVEEPERPRVSTPFDRPRFFPSEEPGSDGADDLPQDARHVERRDGVVLSWFHGPQQHVVRRAKELIQERPTGHILRSGRALLPSDDTLSVTAWMSGVFASQLTIGNTSFHKLLSVARHPLNALTSSGLRILIRTDDGLELLGLPSSFEMGSSWAEWRYRDARRSLRVRLTASADEPACRLTIEVERGGPLELTLSHNIVVGEHEHDPVGPIDIDRDAGLVELRPDPSTALGERYPGAAFVIAVTDPGHVAAIGGDGLLHSDGIERGGSYLVIRTKPVDRFSIVLTGDLDDAERARGRATRLAAAAAGDGGGDADEADARDASAFWSGLARSTRLGGGTGRRADDVARLDDLVRWYVHDGLIHATTPHGLEQSGGAAWGLRDVCQGPTELFVATGRHAALRDVLRTVYEHQDRETGDWPQWFMLDRHRAIRAADSHGDIIHWPIKALCDYVEATNDLAILDEPVPWTDRATGAVTQERSSILVHTERQIDTIERDCIPGTALVVFAGGDWEDTLQPVDRSMARRLVSAWTVELAYQTLGRYRIVCERAGRTALADRLAAFCTRIRDDFQRHLVPDGIVTGLAEFRDEGIEYYLHPRDRRTGVDFRLLPMTRGMISGLFSPEQVERHVDLIERHLRFPDGVRLMNRPMTYRGGPSRIFQRAESAANVGREIGLQYVHAHIRYVEAMARIGRPDDAFWGLMAICPIGLEQDVPSAQPRQSNAFFSSSDAAFADRYEASRDFDRLRTGEVGVRGGWRVYSSGPGIFINQLVSNVLGLRTLFDDVVFDPVLPPDAEGLTWDVERDGRLVRYRFHVTRGFGPTAVHVNGSAMPAERRVDNPYRLGGLLVARALVDAALIPGDNVIDVFV